MAIEKMELVNIVGPMQALDETLKKCCDSGCFHMESAAAWSDNKGEKLLSEKTPYQSTLKELATLAGNLNIELKETEYFGCELETAEDFSEFCRKIRESYVNLAEDKQKAMQIVSERKAAEKQLAHLEGLHEDFDKIFACKHVAVRVGKLPVDSREKLEYYKDKDFFFVPFDCDKNFCWGMYFCPNKDKNMVDDMFKSLYFERVMIPDFVSGNPQEAYDKLNAEIQEKEKLVQEIDEKLEKIKSENEEKIRVAFTKLKFKNDIFELRKNVGVVKNRFYIKGFVPKKKKKDLD